MSEKSSTDEVILGCLGVLLGMVIGVLLILWMSFVGMMLWSWFITPIFSIPKISLLQMTGLLMFLYFVQFRSDKVLSDEKDTALNTNLLLITRILGYFLTGLFYLILGFIIHLLI